MDSNSDSSSDLGELGELLNSDVNSATQSAYGVRKDDYSRLVALGNVTSFSMEQVLHACARKFQLLKLGAAVANSEGNGRESNPTFAFGHAVGAGVACYDQTRNLQQALFASFLAWDIDLFEEEEQKPKRPPPKKSFHHAVWALYLYEQFYLSDETDLRDYAIVKLEAALAVDFENGYFYVGHIDEQLQHRETGKYKIKENKTTIYNTVDPALYSNSDQALSYALVMDSVGASEYDVLYTIYSSTDQRWIPMEFTKTSLQKAEWLQDHTMMQSQIQMYSDSNFFPKRGRSCIEFGRRCVHYETCDYNSDRVYGMKFSYLETVESFEQLEMIKPFDYKFKWSEIVATQKAHL